MKRYLRIGVLRGGRLVDDRYVPEKGEVTVGSSAKNMFALLGSHLPKEHVLFHFDKKHPVLHIVDGMTGEVALDGHTKESLESAKARAHRNGQTFALEIPDSARGWVQLADATFFFQVAPKPPPPPKRELPKSAKTGLLSGIEVMFVGILVGVMSLEGIAIFAIHSRPPVEVDQPSAEDLDRFAEIIMPEKPKDEPKKDEEDEAKKKAAEEAKKRAEEEAKKRAEEDSKKKDEEEKKPKSDEELKAAEAARKAKIKEAVSKKGLLSVIGATGGAGSALGDLFKTTGFSDDIGKALADTGGVKLASGDDGPGRKGGSGNGEAVGIGDLGGGLGAGGGKTGLAEKARVAPKISIDESEFETESTSVDKDSLGKFIKMRIKSVQQCYEKELKRNPSLKGKIVVRFVITTVGRVGDVSIDQNTMGDENVAACIMSLVRRWTFPIKPEEDAPVSFPFVFSPGG